MGSRVTCDQVRESRGLALHQECSGGRREAVDLPGRVLQEAREEGTLEVNLEGRTDFHPTEAVGPGTCHRGRALCSQTLVSQRGQTSASMTGL